MNKENFMKMYSELDWSDPEKVAKCFFCTYNQVTDEERAKFDKKTVDDISHYLNEIKDSSYRKNIMNKIRVLTKRLDFDKVRDLIQEFAKKNENKDDELGEVKDNKDFK